MTVAELRALLNLCPGDLPVYAANAATGDLHELFIEGYKLAEARRPAMFLLELGGEPCEDDPDADDYLTEAKREEEEPWPGT